MLKDVLLSKHDQRKDLDFSTVSQVKGTKEALREIITLALQKRKSSTLFGVTSLKETRFLSSLLKKQPLMALRAGI